MSHTAISIDQDQLVAKEIIQLQELSWATWQLLYWESVELVEIGKKKLISENDFVVVVVVVFWHLMIRWFPVWILLIE